MAENEILGVQRWRGLTCNKQSTHQQFDQSQQAIWREEYRGGIQIIEWPTCAGGK